MESINVFSNGMHSDNDPSMQPEGTYRDSQNGNIIAYGQNRFTWESVKGTKSSFTIPNYLSGYKHFTPIGWIGFKDYLLVFSANDQSSTSKPGEIGKVTFDNDGEGTYTPLYHHYSLGFTKDHPIPHDGIIAKSETSGIQRVVWTDNYNSMRMLNVLDSRLSTNIASGSLVDGKRYMVISKAVTSYVTYNAVNYGAGYGNTVFTASAAIGLTYTETGTCDVIEYIPLEALAISPNFSNGNILYHQIINGQLTAGQYQYFYQLETDDGTRTNWSYISQPIANLGQNGPSTQTISYARRLASITGTITGYGLRVKITNIDNDVYSKIRIGYILSTAEGTYNDPKIFIYEDLDIGIVGKEKTFDHIGNEVILETLSLNDLTTPSVILDLVKSITTTKNILFAANVGSSNEPVFDLSNDLEIKTVEYRMPSDIPPDGGYTLNSSNAIGYTIANGYALFGHRRSEGNGANPTQYMPYQWYEVYSGDSLNYVTYNGLQYYPNSVNGSTFQIIPGSASGYLPTINGSPLIVAIIGTEKYTNSFITHRVENDFLDHKGISATFYKKSYWRGERYRFGLVTYGKKGQPSFVYYLGDKSIPEQFHYAADTEVIKKDGTTTAIGFDCRLAEYYTASGRQAVVLRSLGLKFNKINFNLIAAAYGVAVSDLGTVISGFSIVRLERDSQIIHQGFLLPTVIDAVDTAHIKLLAAKHAITDANHMVNGRKTNYYCYYSPDTLSNYPTTPNVQAGDYLRIVDFYTEFNTVPNVAINIGDRQSAYEKFITPTTNPAGSTLYDKSFSIGIYDTVTQQIERGAENIALGNGYRFSNVANTNLIYPLAPNKFSSGCNAILVNTTATESGGTSSGIGAIDANYNRRVLVNWYRPKANLYGGNDESTKATHLYKYCGHYQSIDSDFLAHLAANSNMANDVEVFGGDAYVSLFGLGQQIEVANLVNSFAFGYVIPIESNINENWRGVDGVTKNDRTLNSERFYDPITCPDGIVNQFPISPGNGNREYHNLDTTFILTDKQQLLPARPLNFSTNNRQEHTVYYSLEKVDGEIIDNWKIFKPANYKQIDGQFGAINNIRAKGTRLFYWQDNGVGVMPVFEKVMQNSLLGENIQLGVGGILDRFDEIDYFHGNQHQMSLMEGEDAFMWFDFRNREVMRLGYGGEKNSLSVVKGLDAYFQNVFEAYEDETGSTIFNSDNPMQGYGILSYYDPRFKLGLMTFKINNLQGSKNTEADFTIAFNRHLDKYIGFMSFTPSHMVHYGNYLLMSKSVRHTIQNSTAYAVGDPIQDSGTFENYVCIVAFTSGSPATQPSSDPTHWSIMNSVRNIHVAWRNDICKFFGVVYPASLTYVAKSPDLTNICVDNIEVAGNDTRLTDVYIENRNESASDTTIRTTNRNYRYFDGSWWFNLPLTSKRIRLADHYLQVKLQIKNYTGTSITSALNTVKRIMYVKNFLRRKL